MIHGDIPTECRNIIRVYESIIAVAYEPKEQMLNILLEVVSDGYKLSPPGV